MNTWNRRACWRILLLAAVVGCSGAIVARAADLVEVTATGEGIDKDSALRDAQRKALEQGAGSEISSRSEVENFELIRDTVYARSDGCLSEYKILEQGEGIGGVYFCKIKAVVNRSAVASTWGEVQNVLDQVGRPSVAIYIVERIDGALQESSILESKLEERLVERGFDVRAGEQLREINKREMNDAELEQDTAKMQALAKRFNAPIFITGTSSADAAGVRTLAGQQTAMYNADAMVKMYYTDNAKILASESLTNGRGGARGYFTHSPQAGKRALERAGEDLVDQLYEAVMRNWATQISYGGEVELEVSGVKLIDAVKLKKKLRELPKVERVNGPDMTKDIARFRILAKMNAEQMIELLIEDDWTALIEVQDLKLNRIQAKWVKQ